MTITAVLLDLDGTLLDTLPDLADAVNAMRLSLGLAALPQALIGSYVGKGATVLVRRSLTDTASGEPPSDELLREGLEAFRRHYHRINGERAVPYPDMRTGLTQLRAMGLKLAIVTNKPTEFTLPLLSRSGLAADFDCVVCGDTCARAKPDPMPLLYACEQLGVSAAQAVMIGDSVNDALAARAAGITVLAVPYGYNEGHEVQSLDVDAIVSSIADAARWVAQRQTPATARHGTP